MACCCRAYSIYGNMNFQLTCSLIQNLPCEVQWRGLKHIDPGVTNFSQSLVNKSADHALMNGKSTALWIMIIH